MGNASYISTKRLKNHCKASAPCSTILTSHYDRLNTKLIKDQTGSADWFIAELKDAGMGGYLGHIYLIYNPTDTNGKAVVEDDDSRAKLAAAPCPPFCSDESPGVI